MLIFSEVFEVPSDGIKMFSGPDRPGSLNLTNIPKFLEVQRRCTLR